MEALRQSAPLVTLLSPEMRIPAALTANGKAFRPWYCVGVWPSALELNEHVVEHGRMLNELDDEMARNVCVIGTATRDELWGAPEKVGREINPVGETLFINGVPFTVIGMFQHYESEQDRKERLLAQSQAGQPQAGGVTRNRGWGGGQRRGNFVYLPQERDRLSPAEHGLDEVSFRREPDRSCLPQAAAAAPSPEPPATLGSRACP